VNCRACAAIIQPGTRFCPLCGQPLDADTDATRTSLEPGGPRGTTPTPANFAHGRFAPGTLLSDRYRIVARLGAGGMGEVYRADDLKLGQAVALKFLPAAVERDPLLLEKLTTEVRTARQISHPNVCRVYDMGEADGRGFLTMEYVDGEDLQSLLRRIGRLSEDKGLEIARQICAGLTAMHNLDVLHRDLKPANVMLDGRGRVRLTDFGLATTVDSEGPVEIAGTPAYMAPEQFAGQTLSVATDLYAVGLVLWEIFTGERPQSGQSAEAIRATRKRLGVDFER
jgi:serine/threonine-protein kinase